MPSLSAQGPFPTPWCARSNAPICLRVRPRALRPAQQQRPQQPPLPLLLTRAPRLAVWLRWCFDESAEREEPSPPSALLLRWIAWLDADSAGPSYEAQRRTMSRCFGQFAASRPLSLPRASGLFAGRRVNASTYCSATGQQCIAPQWPIPMLAHAWQIKLGRTSRPNRAHSRMPEQNRARRTGEPRRERDSRRLISNRAVAVMAFH